MRRCTLLQKQECNTERSVDYRAATATNVVERRKAERLHIVRSEFEYEV